MWNESIHVRDPKNREFDHYDVAVDYGTGNPTTFGLYGWNDIKEVRHKQSKIPKSYLIDEYYFDSIKHGKQKTDAEYAKDFNIFISKHFEGGSPDLIYKNGNLEKIWLDPSAASFKAELQKKGWSISNAKNDVIDGIRFKSTCLSNERFFVSSRCKHTIMEHASYVWDANAQRRGEDKPVKEHDHCMDRDRYFLFSRFGPRKKKAGTWGEVN